ncbi:hypothetical protein lacNasYZ03_01000 [Lactobacillus nasalidis]|uniref:Uncharacterized protein n=1 Tax=Lactobacillus nasalidis TaxID=2797258 RepID=A0ABQ3W2C4_9LACO|nr:HAD hydrolase family protein [Lactobacillus nasalidis]GHV96844.1 hypothetical protein lacNasYZ01_00260 [Lactobacillus nasalidis]GHV98633.1 hypothetical protein lacNasYZ02_00630 [Lactobacillus nasalidis]GHW00413.1 hypothetical protein lacNasYZ03_01000 [Lactobacillus nasalidis]
MKLIAVDMDGTFLRGDGVAVANAIPALKEAAKHVTLSNKDQGGLDYLEKYLDNLD